jgi:hypothetical protein
MEYNEGIKLDYRCCIPNTDEAKNIEKTHINVSSGDFKNFRLKLYLEKVINSLSKGNRDNAINAFVYIAKNTIQADSDEIHKALSVIEDSVEFDGSFTKSAFKKFYKRV